MLTAIPANLTEVPMHKLITIGLGGILALNLGGCAQPPTKQQTGAVVGGVLGGVLGSQVGGGHGKTAAIIGGTIIGGLIGGAVGKSMDETDQLKAQHAFEYNRSNEPAQWRNPDTGNEYTVTPTRTYNQSSGEVCREYTSDAYIGGRREQVVGTACRQSDGSWRIVN
jgi:surface antigen